MKIFLFVLITFFVIGINSYGFNPPDEGMWLPMFVERLNYTDMEKMGLQLTAEEIYSINNSSLKDAIVGLSGGGAQGFFCTGEIVSDQGLLFTNHHCGFSYIQKHSTVEHDYLTNGFWAETHDEELPNKNMSASFLIRMENLTDSIMPFLSDTMSEADRSEIVGKLKGKYEKIASEDGKYNAVVKSFFAGNEYYMFVYTTYDDVRFVGAPPSSVGKYGGDTDNWMWPRHTGDFSIFRVYSAPDGSSAKYSKENIPLKPKHHLPISIAGFEKDDFTMIWGYPGGTERFLTSSGIEFKLNNFYPFLIDVFGTQLEIWKEDMDVDKKVKIQYASKYAGIANAWKLFIGQSRGLKKLKVFDKKTVIENNFTKWVDADTDRKAKYGNALNDINEGYKQMAENFKPLIYTNFAINGSEILSYTRQFNGLLGLLEDKKENEEAINKAIEKLKAGTEGHFKNYNEPTDMKVMAAMLELYCKNTSVEMQPEYLRKMIAKFKGNFIDLAKYVFEKSVLSNTAVVNEFLDNPKYKKLKKDPAMILSKELFATLMKFGGNYGASQTLVSSGNRLFVAGLREMNPDKVYYPDANSTMRLSYGSIQDYYPADAVHYDYVTTIDGVMEKEDPENDEFIVEKKLKELYQKKDYGPYAKDGKLVTCFLTTNDITGGNSGSPVINANGELIGLAFDGNWEAMSGDIAFEPELQRTICVDIRYVLFIIDKYAGAQNLINELTIVKEKHSKLKAEETKTEEIKVETSELVEVE